MSYSAQVFRILIASPSDVYDERDIAVKTIQEWNDLHSAERQVVLLPLKWETHSAPEYGKRPQEVINRQVVDQCDLLVGAFWTRIGSPTGIADSGTLEEIERVAQNGKPIMLYFSKANKNPDDIDLEQLQKLREFKKITLPNALIENYSNHVEFRDKLARQLEIQLRGLLSRSTEINNEVIPNTDIVLRFSDPLTGDKLNEHIEISATDVLVNDYDEIPDYITKHKTNNASDVLILSDMRGADYYRTTVDNIVQKNKNKPIRFWLTNLGSIGARDVYIDVKFRINDGKLTLRSRNDSPRSGNLWWSNENSNAKDYSLNCISDNIWNVSFEMRALQPKREVTSDFLIYVGAEQDCLINIEASIYADTLSEPIIQKLSIDYKLQSVAVDYINLLGELEDSNQRQKFSAS